MVEYDVTIMVDATRGRARTLTSSMRRETGTTIRRGGLVIYLREGREGSQIGEYREEIHDLRGQHTFHEVPIGNWIAGAYLLNQPSMMAEIPIKVAGDSIVTLNDFKRKG